MRRLIILILLILMCVNFQSNGQPWNVDVVGRKSFGVPWTLVKHDEPYVVLRGNLLKWSIWAGSPVAYDWDLCIFVMPNKGYEKYAKNFLDLTNPADDEYPAGTIELEVVSLGNALNNNPVNEFTTFFDNLFVPGREVEAYGLWVQDWSHKMTNPKTELHPLTYIKQVYGNETSIYSARDVSRRFTTYAPLKQISIPLLNTSGIITVKQASISQNSRGCLITERSMMDISTHDRSKVWRGISVYPSTPEYTITFDFGEPNSVDRTSNGAGFSDLDQGHYHPFFLGKVTLANDFQALNHAITLSVKTCAEVELNQYPAQNKILEVVIDATLLHGSYNYSRWRLSKRNPDIYQTESDFEITETEGMDANTGHFVRYYSPILGLNDNRWLLSLYSASNRSNFNSTPPKAGAGPYTISFFEAEQIYEIKPSELSLEIPIIGLTSTPGILGCQYSCVVYDSSLVAKLTVIPGVEDIPNSFKWRVQPTRDALGNSITSIPEFELTISDIPWRWSGIELTIDQMNPRRLIYSTSQDALQSQVRVTASLETNIGEYLSAEMYLPGPFMACAAPNCQNFGEQLAKGEAALEKLEQLGLAGNEIPTLLNDRDIRKLFGKRKQGGVPWQIETQKVLGKRGEVTSPLTSLPRTSFALPEPYKLIPKFSGEPRQALEALYKMASGVQLTKIEYGLLMRLAIFGSKLKWLQQPPEGAFDLLVNSLRQPSLPK